jgi:hypothetical protein
MDSYEANTFNVPSHLNLSGMNCSDPAVAADLQVQKR